MKSVYSPFLFVLIALLSCAVLAPPARAQDASPFTVEGVRADASAESATKARESAFAQAQSAAFATLAGRILSPEDVKRLNPPDAMAIGPMIHDFEIVNEKISTVRYIATYTFRFDPDAVRAFLAGRGLTSSQTASTPDEGVSAVPSSGRTLILPFFETANRTILWSDDNPWRRAWQAAPPPGTVLPAGDLDDMRNIPDDSAMTYDPASLQDMVGRYGAAQAIVAVARSLPDPRDPRVTGSVEVYLYQAGANGPAWLRTVSVPVTPGTDLYAQAVLSVSQTLNGQESTGVASHPLTLYLTFSNPDEWMATQRALETFSGLNDLKILSLTPRRAILKGAFAGDETALVSQGQTQGLTVTPAQDRQAYTVCLQAYCAPTGGVP